MYPSKKLESQIFWYYINLRVVEWIDPYMR